MPLIKFLSTTWSEPDHHWVLPKRVVDRSRLTFQKSHTESLPINKKGEDGWHKRNLRLS
ncbi:hypothetical protein VIBNISOn1_p0004 [Vibrio nigripulchritudo SOn1]|uniref:Uncharacterized protein n=1 Tax=Vibrio nigripulchritudo SOn1 TaxID=1238450 RepID=A0AAV2VZX2_9VIBR|nr:hypothetical protein VIBNISOn1_p0004 [Vibrio nigripulchritudo SOn1]